MAIVVPDSVITLYKGIEITDGQQLVFSSTDEQTTYFTSHVAISKAPCSYVRKNGFLKVEVSPGVVDGCNYLSFKNPSFENRIFYAKILTWEYINVVTVSVAYQIDYFQSYLFDFRFRDTLIEREHLSESDYLRSETNPYDPSIYEFQTGEDLPTTKDMEENYLYTTTNFTQDPSAGCRSFDGSDSSGVSGFAIVVQISKFDESVLAGTSWEEFKLLWTGIIDPDGKVTGNLKFSGPDSVVPHAYSLYVMYLTESDAWTNFQKALDYLTYNDLTQNVLGVYHIPIKTLILYLEPPSESGGLPGNGVLSVPPRQTEVVNKKLVLSPFEYIRINNGNGETKEYKYEEFYTLSSGQGGTPYFFYKPMYDGTPMVSLLPYRYNYHGGDTDNFTVGLNVEERVDILNIPQIAYSTDAYLAFVSAQYQKTVGERSTIADRRQTTELATTGINVAAQTIGAVANAATGKIGGISSSLASGAAGVAQMDMQYQEMKTRDQITDEIHSLRLNDIQGDAVNSVFGVARPAFVADQYHAGSTNGFLNFYCGALKSSASYFITRVRLKPAILKIYDKFFTDYGYSSRRVGIPRIYNYIRNTGDMPHFTGGKTYCKTSGAKISGVNLTAARFIAEIFNSGCRFLKQG